MQYPLQDKTCKTYRNNDGGRVRHIIPRYSLYMDDSDGEGVKTYAPVFDGMIQDASDLAALIDSVANWRRDGAAPIVTIFAPGRRHD